MVQIYFLLIVTNFLGGAALASELLKAKIPALSAVTDLLANAVFKGILGVVTFIVGFSGLLSVLPGDLPLLGDLFPCLSALLVGTGLVLEYYHFRNPDQQADQKHIDDIILKNKAVFGIIGMAMGLVHLVFPTVLLV